MIQFVLAYSSIGYNFLYSHLHLKHFTDHDLHNYFEYDTICMYPFRSHNVVNLHTSKMSTKLVLLRTLTCSPGGIAGFSDKKHPRTLKCGWVGLRCGSRGFNFPFTYPFSTVKKAKKSVMSALCHEPIDASRGGVARWKGWERDG